MEQKRQQRKIQEEKRESVKDALEKMDTILLNEDAKVEEVEKQIEEMKKIKEEAKKSEVKGAEVDMIDKYLDDKNDQMGVFATISKRKKMDKTVQSL